MVQLKKAILQQRCCSGVSFTIQKGKSILQVPDTTRVLDNAGPILRSSIVSFRITPARS